MLQVFVVVEQHRFNKTQALMMKKTTMVMGWHWRLLQAVGVFTPFTATVLGISVDRINGITDRGLEYYEDYFEYDLSEFSLRFDRCQYVKMFDDELAQDEESDSPLAIKHFAVFRLCPSDTCSSSCSPVSGSYVAEVDDYLQYTIDQQEKAFENMCDNCQERCNENGEYCSGCGKLCYRYQNLENSGYVDAANFVQCQQLEMNNANGNANNNGDDGFQLYIGPRCSQDGNRILIGLFSDEECLDPYTDEDPEDYLGAKISYHLLSHTYQENGSVCLSCMEDPDDENDGDAQDADYVNEMCEEVYNLAAKCESKNGLTSGFIQMNLDDGDYENQVENEFMTCNFIDSLLYNSYTETGDINLDDPYDVAFRRVTTTQKISLSLIILSIGGLMYAGYYTQRQIEAIGPKIGLSSQTDAQIT